MRGRYNGYTLYKPKAAYSVCGFDSHRLHFMINFIKPKCTSITIQDGLVPQVTACHLKIRNPELPPPVIGQYVDGFWTINGSQHLPFLRESFLGTIPVPIEIVPSGKG